VLHPVREHLTEQDDQTDLQELTERRAGTVLAEVKEEDEEEKEQKLEPKKEGAGAKNGWV
jgi:hypothetical protein